MPDTALEGCHSAQPGCRVEGEKVERRLCGWVDRWKCGQIEERWGGGLVEGWAVEWRDGEERARLIKCTIGFTRRWPVLAWERGSREADLWRNSRRREYRWGRRGRRGRVETSGSWSFVFIFSLSPNSTNPLQPVILPPYTHFLLLVPQHIWHISTSKRWSRPDWWMWLSWESQVTYQN